jgi:hypothetical protein
MSVTDIVVQTQPSALEWIAAGATALSAVVIAWQAWQTRRSVQASEKAVEVAQAALTESQLARVESGVPRLIVTTSAFPASEKLWRHDVSPSVLVAETDVFKLPRDAKTGLSFSHTFKVRNDGPGTVAPRFSGSGGAWVHFSPEPILSGTEKEYTFTVRLSVARWVKILASETPGDEAESPICATIDVVYSGPRDSDVDETHRIIVRGSALQAVEDAEGDWRRYKDDDWNTTVTARVAPATRTYWRSRSANVKFDTQPIAQGEIAEG